MNILSINITDFKSDPMAAVSNTESGVVAALQQEQPVFYCLTVPMFEQFCELLENLELADIAIQRLAENDRVAVNLEQL